MFSCETDNSFLSRKIEIIFFNVLLFVYLFIYLFIYDLQCLHLVFIHENI